MPRFKSEAVVSAQCDAGIAQYLADMHMKRLSIPITHVIHLILSGSIFGQMPTKIQKRLLQNSGNGS